MWPFDFNHITECKLPIIVDRVPTVKPTNNGYQKLVLTSFLVSVISSSISSAVKSCCHSIGKGLMWSKALL